jgi:hypothetical protein
LTGGAAGSEGAALTISLNYAATLAGNPTLTANQSSFASTGLIFEGATDDVNEALLTVTDPGADVTYTLGGASGTLLTTGNYTGTLDSIYVNVGESPAAGDITGSFSGGLNMGVDSVALTTDTTGNYVQSVATSGPLSGGAVGSEGATLTLGITADAIDFTELSDTLSLDAATSINAAAPSVLTMGPNITLEVSTGKNMVMDNNDTGDEDNTYMVHDTANDRINLYVDGVEVARFKK